VGAAGVVAGVAGAVGAEKEAGKAVGCAALRGQPAIPLLREEGVEGQEKLVFGALSACTLPPHSLLRKLPTRSMNDSNTKRETTSKHRILETTLKDGRRMWFYIPGPISGRTIPEGRK